jgi:hypothetical protein
VGLDEVTKSYSGLILIAPELLEALGGTIVASVDYNLKEQRTRRDSTVLEPKQVLRIEL